MINNYLTINANNLLKKNNGDLPKASRAPSPSKNETDEKEAKRVLKLKAKVDE